MKTTLAILSVAALLGACASQPQSAPAAWGYQPGQTAPAIISEAEAATLTQQVAEFKASRRQVAASMANVSDPAVRAARQRDINHITEQLQPLEYRLRAAGRPVPN